MIFGTAVIESLLPLALGVALGVLLATAVGRADTAGTAQAFATGHAAHTGDSPPASRTAQRLDPQSERAIANLNFEEGRHLSSRGGRF